MKLTLTLIALLGNFSLHALFSVGIETSHMKRMRNGGAQQNGRMNGVHLSYEHLEQLYLGANYFNGRSKLKGHSGRQRAIASILTDEIYEGRIGYSFISDSHLFALFTGYGYFYEVNDFNAPTPIQTKCIESYKYIPLGFLSGVYFSSLVSMGVNFKVMFMQNAESKITNDPFREDISLTMNEEINIRVEVPMKYSPQTTHLNLNFSLIPFYEFRHYGGREGDPFNYIDTKFTLLGARVALVAGF